MESVRYQLRVPRERRVYLQSLSRASAVLLIFLMFGCARPVVEMVPVAERESTTAPNRDADHKPPTKPRRETLPGSEHSSA